MQGALMKMQQVPSVAVPAKGDLTFAPMAYHVMLLGLKDRSVLADGKHFPLTLTFEKPGTSRCKCPYRKSRRWRPTNINTASRPTLDGRPSRQVVRAAPQAREP